MSFQRRPIRSAQAITPFGPGALMDFPGPESLIHAGLDAWHDRLFEGDRLKQEYHDLLIDNERDLAEALGVDFFITPPPWKKGNQPDTLPWLRFPRWHQCPSCGLMTRANLEDQGPPQHLDCVRARHQTPRQVRFLAACRNGHIRDFPWFDWLVHRNAEQSEFNVAAIKTGFERGDYRLKMTSKGTAGGAGVEIHLEDAGGKRLLRTTLVGAFGGKPNSGHSDSEPPLAKAGVDCNSSNPVLGIHEDHEACNGCDEPLIVTLRGASNLYFPAAASAIHIPGQIPGELDQELQELLEDEKLVSRLLKEVASSREGVLTPDAANEVLEDPDLPYLTVEFNGDELPEFTTAFNRLEPFRRLTESPLLSERIRQAAAWNGGSIAGQDLEEILMRVCEPRMPKLREWRHVSSDLFERVNFWLNDTQSVTREDTDTAFDRDVDSLREREYVVFGSGDFDGEERPRSLLKIRNPDIKRYDKRFSEYFEYVGLIDSLRETRVIRGFERLQTIQRPRGFYERLLWRNSPKNGQRWLPASIVFGEGIFLRFNAERMAQWEEKHEGRHVARLSQVNHNLDEMRQRRGQAEGASVTPRQVMIHTFSHLLINQLIFASGYGTASLRERLYVRPADGVGTGMAGVLIYTAAGDSEGSMGGLVRQGQPGYLEKVVLDAIESAMWCASDPVCIESGGQGPDGCNLAACHSCGLLPETSCELMNRFLDRGSVIGTLDDPDIGYFSELCGRAG